MVKKSNRTAKMMTVGYEMSSDNFEQLLYAPRPVLRLQ